MMPKKDLKQKLRDKDEIICGFLRIPDPAVAEIMALAGVELFIIDREHYIFDYETAQNIVRTAEIYGADCLVRITDTNHGEIGRLLDMGATGVLLANTVNSEQVADLVQAVKYPPIGMRGASTDSRAGKYGYLLDDLATYPSVMNERTVIATIIETKSAIADLDAILAIPEVDVMSVGTLDLTFAFDVPGESDNAEIVSVKKDIYQRIVAAGKTALDKAMTEEDVTAARSVGIKCIYVGSDTGLLKKGLDEIIGKL